MNYVTSLATGVLSRLAQEFQSTQLSLIHKRRARRRTLYTGAWILSNLWPLPDALSAAIKQAVASAEIMR